jgi:hypothetical protein
MGDRIIEITIMRNPAHKCGRAGASVAFHPPAHARPFARGALVIDPEIERRHRIEAAARLPDRHPAGHVHQADDRARGQHRAAGIAQQILTPGQLKLDPIVPLIGKAQAEPAGVPMKKEPFGRFARVEAARGRARGRGCHGRQA